MSIKKCVVELSPPEFGGTQELIESDVFVCKNCFGRGYFVDRSNYDQYDSKECDVCKGAGYVKASIVINWIPATLK